MRIKIARADTTTDTTYYDAVDAEGRRYTVTHRPHLNVIPDRWQIEVLTHPKRGRSFWRTVNNGRVLATVQHFARSR